MNGEALKRGVAVLADFYKQGRLRYGKGEHYGVDKYLDAFGLSVSPKYKGDSVGYHLLKSRTPLCQATGIPLTVTMFSSPEAIHSSLKDGFQILYDTDFQNHKIDGKLSLPRLKSRCVLTVKEIPKAEGLKV